MAESLKIAGVSVRVMKESGLTELFINSKEPLIDWSTHLKGDAPIEPGMYDVLLVPVKTKSNSSVDEITEPTEQ